MSEETFRTFLDTISVCFIEADFETWNSCILRPFTLITKKGPVYLETREALKTNFFHYIEAARIMQLDTVYRKIISLEDVGDGTFIGTYETNLLRKGQRVTDPYISSALLHDIDGTWKMSSIMGARGHHGETGHHPQNWATD